MKLGVIGLGQCGGRIADEFARLQMRSHGLRGLDIIVEAVAVDTDFADLAGLVSIKSDANHRLLVGSASVRGHGTAGASDLGAEILRRESGKITETLDHAHKLAGADAIIVIAASAGGTGSGGLPLLVRALKEKFTDKPAYALLVLPFDHEEDEQSAAMNTAICLKSTGAVADAVILADNQLFSKGGASPKEHILKINRQLVDPFMDLLCAGEEKKPKPGTGKPHTSDVIATLDGWSSLGMGKPVIPMISRGKADSTNTLRRELQSDQGIFAMNDALAQMAFSLRPSGAYKALYMVAGPGKELDGNLVEVLGAYLKNKAPHAQIRGGDYPRDGGGMEVTVILSNFGETDRMRYFREKAKQLSLDRAAQQQAKADRAMLTEEAGRDIPNLL